MTRAFVVLLVAACAALLLATGCTTVTPQQEAGMRDLAAMQIKCSSPAECELVWGRALAWVQANSHWKLRNVTDSIITTEGPMGTTHAAFEITKFPLGNGVYEIRFRAGCGNVFGCVPSLLQLEADFKMNALPPS